MTTTEPMPIAEVSADKIADLERRNADMWIALKAVGYFDEDGAYWSIKETASALADAERKLEEARGLLQPFADAAEDLDEKHGDGSDIWEAPAGMSITAGNLRDAAAFLAAQDGGKG